MAKTPHHAELPLRAPRVDEPLSAWLYRELRRAIVLGRLKPGARLPPSRSLAAQHGIGRGTVMRVFGQLLAEGYLQSRIGSGTTVSGDLPDHHFEAEIQLPDSVRRILLGR